MFERKAKRCILARKKRMSGSAFFPAAALPPERQRGAEILEAALVLPILFFVIFAMIWLGLAFNVSSTLHRAARQALRSGVSPSCALCGNTLPTDTQIVDNVTSVLQAAHLRTTKVTPYSPPFACQATPVPSCTTVQNVQICREVPLTCGSVACQTPPAACGAAPDLGARVSFAYQFDTPLPVGAFRAITIRASAQSPGED